MKRNLNMNIGSLKSIKSNSLQMSSSHQIALHYLKIILTIFNNEITIKKKELLISNCNLVIMYQKTKKELRCVMFANYHYRCRVLAVGFITT